MGRQTFTQLNWRQFETADPQHALLLFCSQPDGATATETAWRLLAQLIQAPFYQRMRTELQLGYGVFSGYRLIDGRPGILFGIQSPTTQAAELLQLIEQFLVSFRTRLTALEPTTLRHHADLLCAHFDEPRHAAEQQWQALKGGQEPGIHHLRNTIATLGTRDLLESLDTLHRAQGAWLCMANSAQAVGACL